MASVVTITLNPAIDKSSSVLVVEADRKLKCTAPNFEPGGGGVNVARVLKRLGKDVVALFLYGGRNGEFLKELLAKEQVSIVPVAIAAETRENFTILESTTNRQYRFGMPGPVVKEEELNKLISQLGLIKDMEFIVISGSINTNLDNIVFPRISEIANQKKAKLIADASGQTLQNIVKNKVYLIKPNLGELAYLANKEVISKSQGIDFGKQLISLGKVENIVLSLGREGAVLITHDSDEYIPAPKVPVKSSVGAGDSMVAGITAALLSNLKMPDAVRYGVASGTAATMNPGTQLCRPEDVVRLFNEYFQLDANP